MKIAVATDDFKNVTGHVGRCMGFLILEVENGEILNREEIINNFTNHGKRHRGNDHHHGHEHSHESSHKNGHERLAEGLSDCSHLICHGLGWRLVENLTVKNIKPIITTEENAELAVLKLEKGELDILDDAECHAH